MHSAIVRGQNVFGLFTSVMTVIGCLIAATDLFHVRNPTASLSPAGLQVARGRPHYYSKKKEEYASVRFNLEADLSSLFTWNTKEVFVYVTAEWDDPAAKTTTSTNLTEPANTAVIWDLMITSPSSDYLSNIGPIAKRKLMRSAEGKTIDPSRGLLRLKNQKPKYQITHPSGRLPGTPNVRLRVHYNVQPWVGLLTWAQFDSSGGGNGGNGGGGGIGGSIRDWLVPARGGAGSPLWKPIAGAESRPFTLPAVGAGKSGGSKSGGSTRSSSRTSSTRTNRRGNTMKTAESSASESASSSASSSAFESSSTDSSSVPSEASSSSASESASSSASDSAFDSVSVPSESGSAFSSASSSPSTDSASSFASDSASDSASVPSESASDSASSSSVSASDSASSSSESASSLS